MRRWPKVSTLIQSTEIRGFVRQRAAMRGVAKDDDPIAPAILMMAGDFPRERNGFLMTPVGEDPI